MSVHYTGPLFQSAKQIRYTSPVYLRDILFRYTDLLYGSVIPASIPFRYTVPLFIIMNVFPVLSMII